jgi:hypothetical protein
MTDRHIVAIGGGGVSDGRDATPPDRSVLSLPERPRQEVRIEPRLLEVHHTVTGGDER